MAINNFALDILGTSFSISVDEDPAYLDEILDQYRTTVENTRRMFGLKDPLVTAVLAGFLLSDELHKEKQSACRISVPEEEALQAEEIAMNIIARIDRVLEDDPSGQA